jgi:hypothetical protein
MPGYGILPAAKGRGLLPWSEVEGQMTRARNYWVVTVTPQGDPHAAPVWGLWHTGRFYFSTGAKSRKGRNLSRKNSVVVHLESGDEAVVIEGTAHPLTDKGVTGELNRMYHAKYGMAMEGGPIFAVVPQKAFAWSESDFPGSATRWVFSADGLPAGSHPKAGEGP